MADVIPNVVISMPSQLFTLARKFQAASNGKIFIGKIDSDPTIPENQIQVYLENEGGTTVPVSQPLIINQAGYPVYNGQIAKFVTVQGHSMAVYDSYGAQQFYYPNVLKYDPDQLRIELAGDNGSSLIGDFKCSASLSSGVISASSFSVLSKIDCKNIIQKLQDMSEEKRIPIDFSGISEICFSGHISVGDFFHWKGAGKFDTTIKPLSLTRDAVGTNGHGVYAWFQRKDPSVNIDFAMLEDIGIDGQYVGDHETPMNR
ncbi:phage head-binding domain-containing protein, partial [Morganella morganii]|uniref:phage head-binding domain-containing protein n=1 Tax=Morganella morganii TaxID=582 RepID=UPI002023EACC